MKPITRCRLLPQPLRPKPYAERLPKFVALERFEMILEWHPSTDRSPRTQRLGFKAPGDFIQAVAEGQRLADMLNRMYGRTLKEISDAQFCRMVAVYAEKAFKSYSEEPLYNADQRRAAVQKQVQAVKAMPEARPGRSTQTVYRVQ